MVSCIAPHSLSCCAIRSGLKADEIFSKRSLVFVCKDFQDALLSAREVSTNLTPSPFTAADAFAHGGFNPAAFDPICEATVHTFGLVECKNRTCVYPVYLLLPLS